MQDYELVVIISPEVADEDVPTAIGKVTQLITARGGTITEVNQWGKRKLAYPIKRHREGNYVVAQFKLKPELTAEVEASLKFDEDIIRHLLVRPHDQPKK